MECDLPVGLRRSSLCQAALAAVILTCVAYLEGISDAVQGFQNAGLDIGVCFPREATVGQSVLLVREWIRNNPDYHDLRPIQAVLPALQETFPCESEATIGANER